ncbi:MAG: phosphodiester glycosidase family protein [Clostridia bacterium]|nr:phosphodiester glycosidase family protein [Clostridia bacterium]
MKRWICLLAVLCLLPLLALGEVIEEEVLLEPVAPEGFPPLNADGFLDEGEFVEENQDLGIWRYASQSLRIQIIRKSTEKPRLVWYEAEIWAREGEFFHAIAFNPDKRWTKLEYPYKIARLYRTVFAINCDFAHLRISQNTRPGFLVRDGILERDRTWGKNSKHFPNLDTLAIFPDGDMRVYYSNELTGEEYLASGVSDVLAFGPFMIRDGEKNAEGLKKYGNSHAQRTGIGMIEKGHYAAVMIEGRHKASRGATVSELADIMADMGCQVAFNLDGGQSSAIIFMGRQLCFVPNSHGRNASARKAAEILGIGTSERVAVEGDSMR